MTKSLIYYSLGGHVQYLDMFKMHLDSLYENCDIPLDILIITNERFRSIIEASKISAKFMIEDVGSVQKSSCQKLSIYKYDLSDYDKVFYCDIDTLWIDKVSKIFEAISDHKISFSSEPSLMCDCVYHGKNLLTAAEIEDARSKMVPALNFGTFGFTPKDVNVFRRIDDYINNNLDKMEVCLEQPYGNVIMYREDYYNTNLDAVVSNGDYTKPKTLLHFLGGPGDFEAKFSKIAEFISSRK